MVRGCVASLVLLSVGCVSLGPKTIPRDRAEYVQGLRDSWKRQLLLNIVGLRYGEAPFFLEVASVINQYSLEGQVSAGVGWSTGVGGDAQGVGAGGRFADRPTITYTPVTGEKYIRSMLTPIPPASLVSMAQAGWPVDFVFRLAVRSINAVSNVSGNRMMGGAGDADFFRVLAALRRIQQSGAIGMRIERRDREEVAVLLLVGKGAEAVADDSKFVRERLGLAQELKEIRIAYGAVPGSDREIAMLTRSMTELLVELASWIDIPEEDLDQGRAARTQHAEKLDEVDIAPLLRVHSAQAEPADAFVAVRVRDHWFFIDDKDLPSKRVFSFLMLLLSLTETGGGQAAPVVTVGAGN